MGSDIGGTRWGTAGVEGQRRRAISGGAQGTAGVGGLAGERSGARAAGRAAVESDIADALQDGGGEGSGGGRYRGARRGRRGLKGLLENDRAHALQDGQLWRAILGTHCETVGLPGWRAMSAGALGEGGLKGSGGERYLGGCTAKQRG